MITGRQIRAARGLLEWKAEDLARKSGVTRVTVSKIESDLVQPQEKTLTAILSTFDKYGIEFLDDDGVRMRKQQMRLYSGKAGYRQLLDHIYDELKEGGRIRQFNFSDNKYLAYADDFVSEHIERMEKLQNIDGRVLALKDGLDEMVSYCDYRVLGNEFKDMTPYYLYNDYIIMSLSESAHRQEFISIHAKLLAERHAKEFDLFWKKSKAPPKGRKK